MPGFDRSGPTGSGSMTGRGQGLCNPGATRTFGNRSGFGGGMACRRGFGGGYGMAGGSRNMAGRFGYFQPYGPPQPQDEKEALKIQADQLQTSLEKIQQRLDELNQE